MKKGVSLLDDGPIYSRLSEMEDGDIAVVRKWDRDSAMIGVIVQRVGKELVPLGKPSGRRYSTCFGHWDTEPFYGVEILKPGTTLVIN